jgi:hypothetical protein
MFGLPKDYMKGNGHHLDWEKNKDSGKGKSKGKKQAAVKKPAAGKGKGNVLKELQAKREAEKNVKPDWFDLVPFKTALEKFVKATAQRRSEFRQTLVANENQVKQCFKDENDELSFKKIVDVNELKHKFVEMNVPADIENNDDIASILMCFGNIEVEKCWGDRVPPETPEETKARVNLANREEKLKEL